MKAGGEQKENETRFTCAVADRLPLVALLPDDIVLSLVEPELEALRGKVGPQWRDRRRTTTDSASFTGLAPRWFPSQGFAGRVA